MPRRRAAPAARVLSTGVGVASTLGIIAAMAHSAPGVPLDVTLSTPDPASSEPATLAVPPPQSQPPTEPASDGRFSFGPRLLRV